MLEIKKTLKFNSNVRLESNVFSVNIFLYIPRLFHFFFIYGPFYNFIFLFHFSSLFSYFPIIICPHNYESGLSQKIKKIVFSYFMFHPFKKYTNKMSVLKNRIKLNR